MTAAIARRCSDISQHNSGGEGISTDSEEVRLAVGHILRAMTTVLNGSGVILQNPSMSETGTLTVAELCRKYFSYCLTYYRAHDGAVTQEVDSIRAALRPLNDLYASLPASGFRPLLLKEVRQRMVASGWCRNQVNQQVSRIKRMFKWAVEDELVPANVFHALQTVVGLKAGRTLAPESEPVQPVAQEMIDAALPHVSSPVRAMIQLQLITGMRPGETCQMRTCDIDSLEQPWLYKPQHHKTEHHQHKRMIFLGPRAQEVIRPFLKPSMPEAYLFSPADAECERRARSHALRKTPMNEGNVPGRNRKRRPRRPPGSRYTTSSYRRAIAYALAVAFPPPPDLDEQERKAWARDHRWHPHQLRHNAATRLRKEFGIDAAGVILGHKRLEVTQIYAEKDVAAAQSIMQKVG